MKNKFTLSIAIACLIGIVAACNSSDVSGGSSTTTGGDSDHTVSQNGTWHGAGLYDPTNAACASSGCHGASLAGADGPSCTSCHSAYWNNPGVTPANHTFNASGQVGGALHHQNLNTAKNKATEVLSRCVNCHGADLNGNAGNNVNAYGSCYQCHGANWYNLPPGNHNTALSGGVTVANVRNSDGSYTTGSVNITHHQQVGIDGPSLDASQCQSCHGNNLDGINNGVASATSCYACHTKLWALP